LKPNASDKYIAHGDAINEGRVFMRHWTPVLDFDLGETTELLRWRGRTIRVEGNRASGGED